MSVLIKGEEAVERYHAHWLQIGGHNNQAEIKGRLCLRVSPFAWIRLVSWSGLWVVGEGTKERKRIETGNGCGRDIPSVKTLSISHNWNRSKGCLLLNMLMYLYDKVQSLVFFYTEQHISVAHRMDLSSLYWLISSVLSHTYKVLSFNSCKRAFKRHLIHSLHEKYIKLPDMMVKSLNFILYLQVKPVHSCINIMSVLLKIPITKTKVLWTTASVIDIYSCFVIVSLAEKMVFILHQFFICLCKRFNRFLFVYQRDWENESECGEKEEGRENTEMWTEGERQSVRVRERRLQSLSAPSGKNLPLHFCHYLM